MYTVMIIIGHGFFKHIYKGQHLDATTTIMEHTKYLVEGGSGSDTTSFNTSQLAPPMPYMANICYVMGKSFLVTFFVR